MFRSAQTIVRSFVLCKPFRFFFLVGLVLFPLRTALFLRWLACFVFAEDYSSRLPGLGAAIAGLLIAGQIWAVAFLADLQSANRRIVSAIRYSQRRDELARLGADAPDGV